jgi:hypothetical protein
VSPDFEAFEKPSSISIIPEVVITDHDEVRSSSPTMMR